MSKTNKYARKQLLDVFGWFWNFTSFGGFTQSRESDNSISKCAWLILAIFGYGITFFQCYKTINTFFLFETNTQITFDTGTAFRANIGFPSVTICNSNRIHCDRLYNAIINCTEENKTCDKYNTYCDLFVMTQCVVSLSLADQFRYAESHPREIVCDSATNENNLTSKTCESGSWYQSCINCKEENKTGKCIELSNLISENGTYYSNPDEISEAKFINAYLNLSASQIIDLAHQPNSMIRRCNMRGQGADEKCSELMRGMTKIFAPKHGICYKFNGAHKNEMDKSLRVDNTGQDNGIHLDIDIEAMYHMRNGLTKSTGAHIVIEESSELPNIIADGFSTSTGRETSISLKLTNVTRLEYPYGSHCVDEITNDSVRLLSDTSFKYSAKSCNSFCYVVNTLGKCNCYEPEQAGGILMEHYDKLSAEHVRCETEQQSCLEDARANFDSCNCQPECNEKIFSKEISNKQWPHDGLWPILVDDMDVIYKSELFDTLKYYKALMNGSDPTGGSIGEMADTLRDYAFGNFMRVNVYFSTLDVELVEEKEKYPDIWSYLGALGGAISVYLGASLLNIFEILEFLIRLIISIVKTPFIKERSSS